MLDKLLGKKKIMESEYYMQDFARMCRGNKTKKNVNNSLSFCFDEFL